MGFKKLQIEINLFNFCKKATILSKKSPNKKQQQKMKRIIRSILMSQNKPDPRNQICKHTSQQLTKQQINQSLIFLSKDHCKTCDTHMCNICSDQHIVDHCHLSWVNREYGEGIEKDFNYGYLMKVNINGIKCICGTELQTHNINHAMCVACGMLSCSDECHHEWEKKGNCTYHTNFHEPNYKFNMRSIRLTNILNIQTSKIKRWNIAQKTSLSFISCYASRITEYIYLQRGFRNYGRPQMDLISRLQKIPFGLDYTTHIQRLCDCTCKGCVSRQAHSAGNCEYECTKTVAEQIDSYELREEFHQQCKCTCAFCSSGIIVDTHRKLDCMSHCYKSHLNNLQKMN